jgi:hypothetical protein
VEALEALLSVEEMVEARRWMESDADLWRGSVPFGTGGLLVDPPEVQAAEPGNHVRRAP